MPKPALSWISEDGKLHPDQITATRHEMMNALRKSFPDLKSSLSLIESRCADLCKIMAPMVDLLRQSHPETPDTTRQAHPVGRTLEIVEATLDGKPLPEGWVAYAPAAGGCAALQHSDQMICTPCGLAWDTNDSCPPDCKPKPPAAPPCRDGRGRSVPCDETHGDMA